MKSTTGTVITGSLRQTTLVLATSLALAVMSGDVPWEPAAIDPATTLTLSA